MDWIWPTSIGTGVYMPCQYAKVTLLSNLLKRINYIHIGRKLFVQATKILLLFLGHFHPYILGNVPYIHLFLNLYCSPKSWWLTLLDKIYQSCLFTFTWQNPTLIRLKLKGILFTLLKKPKCSWASAQWNLDDQMTFFRNLVLSCLTLFSRMVAGSPHSNKLTTRCWST